MDRAQLALLAVCALLTTTVDPFSGDVDQDVTPALSLPALAAAPDADASIAEPEPATQSENTAGMATPGTDPVEMIMRRLAIRHTALPERERRALAHTIVREAHRHGLEPSLVVAVIEVESAGYHLAVSHVGAMGLMQLLPSTAEELAGKLEIEWKGPDMLFDPTINVQLGTAYLRELADRYDGDVSIALAAYNWGPGRIDRRLRRGATVPSLYIEQVMRAYDRHTPVVSRRS